MHRIPSWKTWRFIGLLSLIGWGETGCIAVISDQVRQQADRTLAFGQLYAMPDAYIGRTVILGGYIVRIWNVPGETFLDVLQRPLDAEDRPILTQQSAGRFLVRCDQYLNPLIYTAGRMVTVAGRVLGPYTDTVGERDTVYPLLACVEIYLWPPSTPIEVYPAVPWWWEWDPWYWEPWPWPPSHYHWRRWQHPRHPHHPHHFRHPHHHHRRR
jgi:outer membrane lipoprotein